MEAHLANAYKTDNEEARIEQKLFSLKEKTQNYNQRHEKYMTKL